MTQKDIKRNAAIRLLAKEYLRQAGYGTGVFVPLNVYKAHEADAETQIDEWLNENNHELQRFGLFDSIKWQKELQKAKNSLQKAFVFAQEAESMSIQGIPKNRINKKLASSDLLISKIKKLDYIKTKESTVVQILQDIDDIKTRISNQPTPGPVPPAQSDPYVSEWKTYLKESRKETKNIQHTTKNSISKIKHALNDTFKVSTVGNLMGHKASQGLLGKTFGTSANLLGGSLSTAGYAINGISSLTGSSFKLATNMASLTASFIPKYGNTLAQGIDIFGNVISGAFSLFGKVSGKVIGAVGGLLGGLISTIGKLASAPGNALASNSTIGSMASIGGLIWMLGGLSKGTFAQGLGDVFKGGFSLDKLTELPIDSMLDTVSLTGGALSMVPGMEGTGLSMMIVPQIIKTIKNNFEGIKSFFDEQLKQFFNDADNQWKIRKEEWKRTFSEFYEDGMVIWRGIKEIFELFLTERAPNNHEGFAPSHTSSTADRVPLSMTTNSTPSNSQTERRFVSGDSWNQRKDSLKTFLVNENVFDKNDRNIPSYTDDKMKEILSQAFYKEVLRENYLKSWLERNPGKSNKEIEIFNNKVNGIFDSFYENIAPTTPPQSTAPAAPAHTTSNVQSQQNIANVWKMNRPEEGNFKLKEGELPFTNPGAGTHLEKLNPEFYNRFLAAATEYYNKTGKKVSITDGWRSYDEQVLLKNKKGNLAARPGTSMHGYGMAMDIDSNMSNEMARLGIFDKFGINRPMLSKKPGEKYEPWHIEPAGLDKNKLKASGPSGLKAGREYSSFLGKSDLPHVAYKEGSASNKTPSMIEALLGMGSKMFDALTSDDLLNSLMSQFSKDLTPTSQDIQEFERKMNLPKSNNGFNDALDKISKPLTDGLMEQLKGIHGSLTNVNQTFIQQDSTRDNVIRLDHQESMIMINANILCV